MAADNLPLRDEKFGHGKLPETFAKVRILPKMYVKLKKKNEKKNSNQFDLCMLSLHDITNLNVF